MEETKNVYVNEDQEKHFRRDIQAQAKPPRMNKPRREPPGMEYIYENHPPFHWEKSTKEWLEPEITDTILFLDTRGYTAAFHEQQFSLYAYRKF